MTTATTTNAAPDKGDAEVAAEHQKFLSTYYGSAQHTGAHLCSALFHAGVAGGLARVPHYMAMVGAGMIAASVEDLARADKAQARELFDELAGGLLAMGQRLGLSGEGSGDSEDGDAKTA